MANQVFTTSFNGEFCPPLVNKAITVAVLAGNPMSAQLPIRPTDKTAVSYPVVAPDGFSWVAEGAAFPAVNLNDDVETIIPTKFGGIFKITTEAIDDSEANLAEILADGVRRAAAHKLDLGLYKGDGVAPNPAGLVGRLSAISGGGTAPSLRAGIHTAVAELLDQGTELSAIVAYVPSAIWAEEAGREDDNGNPIYPDGLTHIAGARLVPLPTAYDAETITVVATNRLELVQRDALEMHVDRSVFFATDEVGVKVRARVGLGLPDANQAGRKFTISA